LPTKQLSGTGKGAVLSNKRFIHSPAEKKARTLRSSAGRVKKLDCGIPERDYW